MLQSRLWHHSPSAKRCRRSLPVHLSIARLQAHDQLRRKKPPLGNLSLQSHVLLSACQRAPNLLPQVDTHPVTSLKSLRSRIATICVWRQNVNVNGSTQAGRSPPQARVRCSLCPGFGAQVTKRYSPSGMGHSSGSFLPRSIYTSGARRKLQCCSRMATWLPLPGQETATLHPFGMDKQGRWHGHLTPMLHPMEGTVLSAASITRRSIPQSLGRNNLLTDFP